MLKLGVHASIAGGIDKSVDRAKELGCNAMQIFTRSPRQYRTSDITDAVVKAFKEKVEKENIGPVVVHIPYTLNLAAADEGLYRLSIRDFTKDLIEADKIGAQFLVTHMGSYKGSTEREGLDRLIKAIAIVLDKTKEVKTKILLENTSGSGHWLGYDFKHHRVILEKLNWSQRVGMCLDTAHTWAAGYKIDDKDGVDSLVKEIDNQIGIERVNVIHLNDTKEELGSKHDRHFHIGQGAIGKRGFSCIINNKCFQDTTFILETPKTSEMCDFKNLSTVRELYTGK